ncbi:hypothetical protein ACLB2K_038462 [Fragaria x ananassa]
MRGGLAILNFRNEYPSGTTVGSSSSSSSAFSSSPSSMQAGNQVLELEYLDDRLLEELLDCEEMKSKKNYHALLGRPWLNKHKLIPSTFHQCVKGRFGLKPIRIPGNQLPFHQSEAHYIEDECYNEFTNDAGPAKASSVLLPSWQDIRDISDNDPPTVIRQAWEASACAQAAPRCTKVVLPNGRMIYRLLRTAGTDRNLWKGPILRGVMENECASAEGIPMTPDPNALQETLPAPKYMLDGSTAVAEELETMNLSDDPATQKLILISSNLSTEERKHLVELLKEFNDIFAWNYEEMLGLNPSLVCHILNVELGAKPVVQARRNYHKEDEVQIKQEIEKLLACGFIKPITHPTWLTNIVPLKKKNSQVRVCIDYRDLIKACPKDEFPPPNMDMLIDSTSGQGMLSFMDGFSGYNQMKMAARDAKKTTFHTPYGNFHYTAMPFGLKNAGTTYQRIMIAIFHDMMGKEDYVDDVVVKSKTRGEHWSILRKVLKRCRAYRVKMNPKKCSFGVSIGKFLGFVVHSKGIDVDPDKARAIASTAPPSNQKQLKSFLGRLSYIRHFIPGLAVVIKTSAPLFKKGTKFLCTEECKKAYEKVQQLVTKLPTMMAPIPGVPLKLYLAATDTAVGLLLAQDDENGEEYPVYYVSHLLREAKAHYPNTEKICLALIYATQRLHHYFLAHKLQLMIKTDLVRYLLTKPVLSGHLARWLLQLSGFDIECITPRAIKGKPWLTCLLCFPATKKFLSYKTFQGSYQKWWEW